MGIALAVVVLLALLGFGVVMFGLVNRRRSLMLAIVALFVAIVFAGGAWHAWMESRSIPWTLWYGTGVVLSLIAFIRQYFLERPQPTGQTESDGETL